MHELVGQCYRFMSDRRDGFYRDGLLMELCVNKISLEKSLRKVQKNAGDLKLLENFLQCSNRTVWMKYGSYGSLLDENTCFAFQMPESHLVW